LLVDGALSGRESLEARVGNWLAAVGGESIRPGREPCLGTLKRRELFSEVLGETCVELMLVEVLRASVARFVLFRSRFGILVARARGRLANAVPLAREELAGAIKIHADRVSLEDPRHAGRSAHRIARSDVTWLTAARRRLLRAAELDLGAVRPRRSSSLLLR
jgi:hypothetical protein